jgi:hypothetical protein
VRWFLPQGLYGPGLSILVLDEVGVVPILVLDYIGSHDQWFCLTCHTVHLNSELHAMELCLLSLHLSLWCLRPIWVVSELYVERESVWVIAWGSNEMRHWLHVPRRLDF